MFFSLWGLWVAFECYQIVALKNAVYHSGKGTITLGFKQPLFPSRWVFEEIRRGNDSKGTWMLDLEIAASSEYSIASDCRVQYT
jgi:hypothetical protein